jgi:hypothetical protein
MRPPCPIRLRNEHDPAPRAGLRSASAKLRVHATCHLHPARGARVGLKGDLAELPLPDLIEMTALGGKTGRLIVFAADGSLAGRLDFSAGRLVDAVCGELGADKAFYALLAVRAGTFEFDAAAEVSGGEEFLPAPTLLMEGMRRLDVVERLRRSLPAPAAVHFLGGVAEDEAEASVLARLGTGSRRVGDIVAGVLVHGQHDEYDALQAVQRLASRGVVRVEAPDSLSE